MEDGIYADLNTSKGSIILRLFYDKTPGTVGNFVSLADGTMEHNDDKLKKPFYDGLKFHRVIDNFMIQTGCPEGSGRGGPGYQFEDEFHPDLKHDSSGILSMANAGPNTNGSQFFITHNKTEWLDGKHAVFGKVHQGQDVIDSIEQSDVINQIKILRIGKDAEQWDAVKAFRDFRNKKSKHTENIEQQALEEYKTLEEKYTHRNNDGILYNILTKGSTDRVKKGDAVKVHYTGKFIDGNIFDSSYSRNSPIEIVFGQNQVIRGWESIIKDLHYGEKVEVLIPFDMAYGTSGAGGVIPPYANLIFEIEIVTP